MFCFLDFFADAKLTVMNLSLHPGQIRFLSRTHVLLPSKLMLHPDRIHFVSSIETG